MITKQLFTSQIWRKAISRFTETMQVPSPVVSFTLEDGSSFNVRGVRTFKTLLMLEVYGDDGDIMLRFIPYKNVSYIDLKAGEKGTQQRWFPVPRK